MANKTLIRLAQLTGSLDASGGAIHPSAITDKSLQGVLDALAASVKRIHGGSTYSGQAAATFTQTLLPSADNTYDLGSAGAAWKDLHLQGDVLLQDAGTLSTAAGALTITSAAAASWTTTAGDLTLMAANGGSDVVVKGDLVPQADDTYDLGTTGLAWQDLHMEGDVLMQDAGTVSTAAGALTVTSAAAATWSTTAGALTLNGTGGLVLQEGGAAILGISDARAVTVTNAASIDADASGVVSIDSSAGSITMGAILADGQTLTLGKAGAVEMQLAPHGTASSETFTLLNTAGTATNSIKLQAMAGGVDIDAKLVLALDGEAGVNLGIATSGAAVSIGHSTSETTVNDNLTVTGDLTVNGATVTVDTTNLNVKDPVIMMSAGAQALNSNQGLLFQSGSSAAARPAVAFGRVANDIWGLGSIAVPSSGTMTTVAGMTHDVGLRLDSLDINSMATNWTNAGRTVADAGILTTVDINGGTIGGVTIDGNWTALSQTCANLGTVSAATSITSTDLIGTNVDGIIGADTARAGTFTTCDATTDFTIDGLVLTADTITNDAALTVVSTGFTVNASLDIALSADGGNVTMDDGSVTVFDFNVDDSKMKIQDPAQVANFLEVAVSANGATTMTTVDADAAAANLIITADGTFEAVGTTITLDSGGAINLEPAGGSAILLDGTISIDAGVVTGATSVTSTNFDGIIGAGNARAGTFALVTGTSLDVNGAADISGVTDLAAAGVATNVRGTLAVIQQADFTANLDATGGVDIDADNIKLTVGAGADLEMVHNGTDTSMKNKTGMFRIESSGGNLVLSSSAANSEIQFGDAYNGNILTNGLFQLADSAAEWNSYVSNFSVSKSLVGALNSLASGGTRSKFQYAVTGSHAANIPLWINASLDHDQGTGGPASLDVFVNGQLLTSGTVIANGDYKIGIADADRVQFFFALESGDQVTINKP